MFKLVLFHENTFSSSTKRFTVLISTMPVTLVISSLCLLSFFKHHDSKSKWPSLKSPHVFWCRQGWWRASVKHFLPFSLLNHKDGWQWRQTKSPPTRYLLFSNEENDHHVQHHYYLVMCFIKLGCLSYFRAITMGGVYHISVFSTLWLRLLTSGMWCSH